MLSIRGFIDVARLPAPGDNVAIATTRLDAGTSILYGASAMTIDVTVLEGHRFAIQPIARGEALLSWGLPFGVARRAIQAGSYVCNARMLQSLGTRRIDFTLPLEPNFDDVLQPYHLDEAAFRPGTQVPPHAETRPFAGYRRPGGRGVGTRNYIVIMGTTSRTSGYAQALAERLAGRADGFPAISGIVPVAHTEGGGEHVPNNRELLLRTLSGFMVHPNVGAVLAVDDGEGPVTNESLRRYMQEHEYPLSQVPHHFLTLGGGFEHSLEQGRAIVEGWLPLVAQAPRTPESLAHLSLALQCGGSDAFSGISGNPLAAWVARELIRYGGKANLAETDELMGAEHYVLHNVRDLATARAFLRTLERFRERLRWHGHTAEGNPSGGNNFRGLYNIALKSLGAATKRHPDVRLDYVIDYAQRMAQPGYYFMDSPGNDLESVAGQVAAGCTMIFFVTGNGSITNFPFVPTIKIVTTTGRYRLLSQDMDVNAGAYLDGTPMDELGRDLLDLTVDVASGTRSVGERAGHAQVSIWRNWMQSSARQLPRLQTGPELRGEPIPVPADFSGATLTFTALKTNRGDVPEQLGLIMPTSLCSGQIARQIATRLNKEQVGGDRLSRFVALPHTEGCGASAGSSEVLYARTVVGYLTHPLVGVGLLLEHGCEKTHNDYFRAALLKAGADPARFGWASVQLDGGIEAVTRKVEEWARARVAELDSPVSGEASIAALRVGLASVGPLSPTAAESLARLTTALTGAGATVVVPERATLLAAPPYLERVLGGRPAAPSLAYGAVARVPGLHIMEAPTDHWVETLTGLAATGVELVLVHTGSHPLQGHRLIPVVQVTGEARCGQLYGNDLDLVLQGDPSSWRDLLLDLVIAVAARRLTPRLSQLGQTDVQFTRGLLGVSM
ncbi:MAG: hypothetical protein NVSMB65_00390 [Chloroflexota bacterium]